MKMAGYDLAKNCVLGIDIGGTNIRCGLIDNNYNIYFFQKENTHDVLSQGSDLALVLIRYIRNYCHTHLEDRLPLAVSIGFPSTINRQRTVVMQTPNIENVPNNFPLVELLERDLKIPVFVNRDVNFLMLFDLEDLNIADLNSVVGIYFGTGIGNAIYLNGKLLLGHNGVAAELGHLPIYGNKRVCSCGNTGCLETLISGGTLHELQRQFFPGTAIKNIFKEHKESPEIQEFISGLAQTVAIEVNIFDPDCVVVGGGLTHMEGFPKDEFVNIVRRYTRKPYPALNLEMRYSRASQKNGVIGAGIYAFKRIADPNYI